MDTLTKAITTDKTIRIYSVIATETAETARQHHQTTPVATAALGRILSAGLLMGAMLKGENHSITLQIRGDGPLGRVLAVADSLGTIKGCVQNPLADVPLKENGKLDVGGAIGKKGFLSVIKDLKMKEPYCGISPLQTGEIGDDLAYYFMQSEQTPSIVGVGVSIDKNGAVKHAGGYIVQVMPECGDASISRLETGLKGLPSVTEMLSDGYTGVDIIKTVMLGFDTEILEETAVKYRCNCTLDRVERALISLGRQELDEMIEEQGSASITCQFCDKVYDFSKEDLCELLRKAKK